MRLITKKCVYFCCLMISCWAFSAYAWKPDITEANTPEAIFERISPIGSVDVEGGDGKPKAPAVQVTLGPDAGKKRYETSCKICHAQGVAGAPKFRDKADWASRIDMGVDALTASAIKGKGGMPPRGTCMSCSDEEIKLAVEYMIPQS